MLKIGLTGGMGSGKSTVARIFETLGIPVYRADEAARRIMNTDVQLKADITRYFGPEAYHKGMLNRAWVASVVFNDPVKLDQLNALVHPATIRDAEAWFGKQRAPYVIKEAAVLFESGAAAGLDRVIGVFAPESLRIRRVMERDGLAESDIRKRMNRQLDENMRMKLCDYMIRNDEQELLIPQVLRLHEVLLSEASENAKQLT